MKTMGPVLNVAPYPWTVRRAQELHMTLTRLYPTAPAATAMMQRVGIEVWEIAMDRPVIHVWHDIVEAAANRGVTRELVEYALNDQRPNSPSRPFLQGLLDGTPVALDPQPKALDGTGKFVVGSSVVTTNEARLFRDDLSVSVGELPALIGALEIMRRMSPSVCALRVSSEEGETTGTAFRIGHDLLLTNQHVLVPFGREATSVVADFDYEADATGKLLPARSIVCDVESIVTDAGDDWGIVRVSEPLLSEWPIVDISKLAAPRVGERAYILQHPLGGRKKLGYARNTITGVDDRVVHYLTDTEEGSSGSPVLNATGHLVALHHAGGDPQQVLGKPPITKNEGILFSRVAAAVAGHL